MQLRLLFIRSYILVIALLALLLAASLYIHQSNNALIGVTGYRYKAIQNTLNLQKDLEDMTAYCRYFIETRDDKWMDRYNMVLQAHQTNASLHIRSFTTLKHYLDSLEITTDEQHWLLDAETQSIRLIKAERDAMYALKGLYPDTTGAYTLKGLPTDTLASNLVGTLGYRDAKAAVRISLDAGINRVMEMTHLAMNDARTINRHLLNVIIFVLLAVSALMLTTYFMIKKRIMKQFSDIELAKQAIEQSERKFRFFFEQSPDFIILAKHDGSLLECNPAFLRFHGVDTVDALTSHNVFTYFDCSNQDNTVLSTLQTQPFILDKEININSLDKRVTLNTLTTFGRIDAGEKEPWIIAWIKDVTDKVNRESALRKMQTAVEQSPAAIVITDLNGNITYSNKQFSEISGYTLQELLGKNPNILKSGAHDDDFYKDLWDTVLSKNIWKGELFNKRKDGAYFWEEATIAPILNHASEIVNLVAIKQDITLRKEAEAALLESQQQLKELNDSKTKLLSIIGHDLRGPIGTLKMLLDVLISDLDQQNPKDVKKMLESVYASTSVTYDLLENLLMWAKSQQEAVSMTLQSVDLRQAVSENFLLLTELAINKGQTLHNHVPESCLALADKNMTMTVLRNLIMNAIKFSEPTRHIHVRTRLEDAFVVVGVTDEGQGIKPEDMEKLFSLSFSLTGTSGEKGSGLGLALCKDFVERQGGHLWVESELGKGSTFWFRLPLYGGVHPSSL